MLFLLITVAICLLVPWLPVLMYRRLPRRPPPPVSEGELQRLARELQRTKPHDAGKEVSHTEDLTEGATLQPMGAAKGVPRASAPATKEEVPRSPSNADFLHAPTAAPPRSLSLRSYRWLHGVLSFLFIVGFPALAFGCAVLFHYLGEERARSFAPAVFLFKPFCYGIICAVPCVFLGIFGCVPVLFLLARLVLGRRRFLEYLHWDEGRYGGPGHLDAGIKMISGLALFISVACAIFVCLVLSWYARLTEDHIAIKRLFGLGEEIHSYSSVEQIVVAIHPTEDKSQSMSPEDLEIRFDDGRVWNTDQTFHMSHDPVERARLLEFLSRKTGKPITRVRHLEEAPR
jgi:hypothetical protein